MLVEKLQANKQSSQTQLGFRNVWDGPLLFPVSWANDLPQVEALIQSFRETAS